MPTLPARPLLDDLLARTDAHAAAVRDAFLGHPPDALLARPAPDAWSAAECFEHLAMTHAHYLPRIEAALDRTSSGEGPATYRTGWIGHRLAESMRPEQIDRKVKTFRSVTPDRAAIDARRPLDAFLRDADRLRTLIDRSRTVDLARVKVRSLLPVIRLRLGDALRLLVYHNGRHLLQAERALEAVRADVGR